MRCWQSSTVILATAVPVWRSPSEAAFCINPAFLRKSLEPRKLSAAYGALVDLAQDVVKAAAVGHRHDQVPSLAGNLLVRAAVLVKHHPRPWRRLALAPILAADRAL